jgi:hypothetical protein
MGPHARTLAEQTAEAKMSYFYSCPLCGWVSSHAAPIPSAGILCSSRIRPAGGSCTMPTPIGKPGCKGVITPANELPPGSKPAPSGAAAPSASAPAAAGEVKAPAKAAGPELRAPKKADHARPNVVSDTNLANFMIGGRPKGVRYQASYVTCWDGRTLSGKVLGPVKDYEDAEAFLKEKKMTPAKGTVPPNLHPDQLYWRPECDFGMGKAAMASCAKAASNGKLKRIEVDCNIMPCGDRASLSCCCAVPKLIVMRFPSAATYEIHVFAHNVPAHFGQMGKLALLGHSTMSDADWLELYKKAVSWDWE